MLCFLENGDDSQCTLRTSFVLERARMQARTNWRFAMDERHDYNLLKARLHRKILDRLDPEQ